MKPKVALLVAAFLCGCGSNLPLEYAPDAEIAVVGETLIFQGAISQDSTERLFDLAGSIGAFPTTLVITSPGGDAVAGMSLGLWVFRNGIDVHVAKYCLSSCANYVFPAGRQKILEADAALAWHGGAMQKDWGEYCPYGSRRTKKRDTRCADFEKLQLRSLDRFRSAEKAFFAEIGVDQRVTVLGQIPKYECNGKTTPLGWDYSIEDMARLGIANIIVRDEEWNPKSPTPDRAICRVELGEYFP